MRLTGDGLGGTTLSAAGKSCPSHAPGMFGRLSREVRARSRVRHGNHNAVLKEI